MKTWFKRFVLTLRWEDFCYCGDQLRALYEHVDPRTRPDSPEYKYRLERTRVLNNRIEKLAKKLGINPANATLGSRNYKPGSTPPVPEWLIRMHL